MTWDQIVIAIVGTLSVACLLRGWGVTALVLALAAQPAWLVAAIQARQWGIVYICIAYSVIWSLLLWRALERKR